MTSLEIAPGIVTHQSLNPKLWLNKDQLRPEVREKLLQIAGEFFEYVEVPVGVYDIVITGSQCSYGYTDYSDLDLHVIVSYKDVSCDQPVEELFDTKRKLWKRDHDVMIRGIMVEPYVEDLARPVKGSTYSIVQDRWVQQPKKITEPVPDDLEKTLSAWVRVISAAVKVANHDRLKDVKSMLMTYRKLGLARGGELDPANLVFKSLRNMGVVTVLQTAINKTKDRELSLPERHKP